MQNRKLIAMCLALAGSISLAMSVEPAQAKEKKLIKIKIEREVVMADELMLNGKFSDAADLYHAVQAKNPKSVPATIGFGMALAKQFKLDAADEQFNKALTMDPHNAMAHAGKAMVMFNRLASSSQTVIKNKEASLKNAEAEVRQGLAIDPGMPEAHYTLGMILKEQGRTDEAISEFQNATHIDPKYSEAYSGLGVAQLQKDDITGAIQSFKEAIANNSGNSTAHYGLGEAYRRQGLLDEALKELNTSLYQYRNSAPVHLSMAKVYAAQGNTVAGVQQYQECIRIKPENPEAYLGIADIRETRGDLEHSIAELRSGLEMMPNNMDLRLRVADQSLKLEKLDDAIKEYRTIMDANPQNAAAAKGVTRAYYLKANKEATGAFFVSNEYESAKRMLEQAVRLNPNDMELRLAEAKLRSLSGEAVDLKSIGTPTNNGERIAYAEACLAQNKYKESDEQMNIVISNCTDAKQTFAVADLALMIKDIPNAEAAYKKAAAFPGSEERAKRGMDLVNKAKDQARQDLTLADDLARKKQLNSAIDKYKIAIYENPKVADTHLGYAICLEQLKPPIPEDLRQASTQYKAYMALDPTIPPKELEKLNKKIASLEEKAYKLEMKGKDTRSGTKRKF